MNPENTACCETPLTDTTVVTREENTASFVQPEWNARKHDGGVDLEVTLPGVRKEDVAIEIRGESFRLEARRPRPGTGGRLVYGTPAPDGYRLRLRLGESLDGGALNARLEDGVLRIAIPLVEAAQPKKIEVH